MIPYYYCGVGDVVEPPLNPAPLAEIFELAFNVKFPFTSIATIPPVVPSQLGGVIEADEFIVKLLNRGTRTTCTRPELV